LESSTPEEGPGNFEPIQRYSTSLRRFDEYIGFELPTFCGGEVVGCSVEMEVSFVTAAID
jgi:hypothetical protein